MSYTCHCHHFQVLTASHRTVASLVTSYHMPWPCVDGYETLLRHERKLGSAAAQQGKVPCRVSGVRWRRLGLEKGGGGKSNIVVVGQGTKTWMRC